MKKKFRVWQPGFEDEARVVECDEDECPACALGGPPPYMETGDSIVSAFAPVDAPTEIEHRRMTCVRMFIAGWMCGRASVEDIAEALKMADDIKSGREKDLKAEFDLTASSGEPPEKKSGVSVETLADLAEMFVSPASWAARKGAELGQQMMARKCTCEHEFRGHEQRYEKANIGRRVVGGKCAVGGCSCTKFEARGT